MAIRGRWSLAADVPLFSQRGARRAPAASRQSRQPHHHPRHWTFTAARESPPGAMQHVADGCGGTRIGCSRIVMTKSYSTAGPLGPRPAAADRAAGSFSSTKITCVVVSPMLCPECCCAGSQPVIPALISTSR